jgi:glycosyltransferase involved in cell wall biosynthesis
MMVRILVIGPLSGPTGGATILFRQLAAELQTQPDVAVNVVDSSHCRSRISGLWHLLSITFRTIALIAKSDVVSLHVSSMRAALYAAFVWILCAATGRPWILRIFGDASVKHSKMHPTQRELLDWILRRCPLLLVETRIAEQYFRPRCRRVEWYPNSRPLSSAGSRRERAEAARFVFVGHVKPSKGVRDIFAAVHFLGNAAAVDVFGPLRDGIEIGEFTTAVRYCGELAGTQVAKVISKYDAILIPTHYAGEGYPGVILEAFAAGLPVIATRWQAIPEIVTGDNGILVEPYDVFKLAAAMQYLMQSPAECRRLHEGALQTARRFDSVLWTDRFVQFTLDLVAQQQSKQLLAPSSVKPN